MAQTNITAIQSFFGSTRKVSMAEFKALSKEDRAELGGMVKKWQSRQLPVVRTIK